MDRIQQLRDAFLAARANDWGTTHAGITVRMTTQKTPQSVLDAGLYPSTLYPCVEILDFTFTARDRVPIVVYKDRSRPWVEGTDRLISFKRALALLAQPLDASDFHRH